MKKCVFFIACNVLIYLTLIPEKPIILITIPKAGSHLAVKCISLLTNKIPKAYTDYLKKINYHGTGSWWYDISADALSKCGDLLSDLFIRTHLTYVKDRADVLSDGRFLPLFISRDPRDQIVSLTFYTYQYAQWFPQLQSMSFNDRLLDLITKGSGMKNVPPAIGGIRKLYGSYLPWMSTPGILNIKFEDLVGERGGGSAIAQFQSISSIANYLGLTVSTEKINEIVRELFGDTLTFRQGQIGSWKKYFNKKHVEAFKARAGDILIMLGYEKDLDW